MTQFYFLFGSKKYPYSISKTEDESVFLVECPVLNISQEFLQEDVPALLLDFPNMMESKKVHQKQKDQVLKFRVTRTEKQRIEKRAIEKGFKNTSDYLRVLSIA